MYKLTVTDEGYKIYEHNLSTMKYNMIGKFTNVDRVVIFMNKYKEGTIKNGEIEEAIKFMVDSAHNTAEFGQKGYFTVSYYDKAVS